MHLLVSHWSATAAWILFALGVWGVLFITALMKALRLFPVLLDESSVRVRAGTMVDCLVPLPLIAGIETVISHQEIQRRNVLNAAILAHPNVVLRLARPLDYRGLFGKSRMVELVAFRVDEPTPFIVALRERI